ncbi:NAD(P)-binding protein [Trametopsis cervina]|nr:NAD(P)-binding protein [Trametopsis cervina]
MPSYVVTGASRGLGYAIVQQLTKNSENFVIGIVRNRGSVLPGLEGKKNLHIIEADITDRVAIEHAAEEVAKLTGGTLNNLINNAALSSQDRAGYQLDTYPEHEKDLLEKDLLENFRVNVIGVVHTINAFLPLVRAAATASGSAKVVTLNTGIADIEFTVKGELALSPSYAISKTALLMAIAKYSITYKKEGIIFFSISPGLVNTATKPPTPEDLQMFATFAKGFKKASPNWDGNPITPEESAQKVLSVVDGLTSKDNGAFLSHHGNKEWL